MYIFCWACVHVAALQSVFPQTELGALMSVSREDKQKQLEELSDIVAGIRLFNWACKKGGEGIENCKLSMYTRLYHDICIYNFLNLIYFSATVSRGNI